jgi:predicted transposase/invertase (TIGR01784 family)
MIKVDISLREIISKLPYKFIEILSGKRGVKLLDTSLPNVKDKRADLLVELEDKTIFHLELQTFNDKNMPIRMLEYYILIREKYKTDKIEQMVLFIGENLNMPNSLNENKLNFSYILKDIKEINCNELINSNDLEDKILAVLCNIEDENKYINAIIEELIKLDENKRKDYIKKLLSLSRYRIKINEKLIANIKERVMPITIDLRNDPYFKEGLQQGLEQGLQQGLEQGLYEGKKIGLKKGILVLMELGLKKEDIAKKMNLTINEINEILKEYNGTTQNW